MARLDNAARRVRLGRDRLALCGAGLSVFIAASCSTMTEPSLQAHTATPYIETLAVDDLPGWNRDRQTQALHAFTRSCEKLRGGLWTRICKAARAARETGGDTAARRFFQSHFTAYRIAPGKSKRGFLTGYFQPEVPGSRNPGPGYATPLYRRPADLVVAGAASTGQVDKRLSAARRTDSGKLVPYFTRREIERGALRGRGLELVYLTNPVDAFFIHVQGSARIALNDGGVMRVGFAAKNGHPYTSIGKVLVDKGELPRDKVTMTTIRDWFARNPGRIDEITGRNKSFIFFREITGGDADLGPEGAQGVPLTPERSLAVDRDFHELGVPFWIDAELPDGRGGLTPFRKLVIAQDTGSAIRGVARGDIFFGSGDDAGRRAGPTQHDGDFYMLLPKGMALPGWAK